MLQSGVMLYKEYVEKFTAVKKISSLKLMSLYWSVNKNMEIIKNIKEVSDVYFNNDKWDTYDGYCIETDSRKLYFVIDNVQGCCEKWGYLSSEDDFGSFIGSELKNVYVTDTKLETIVPKMEEDLDTSVCSVCKKPQEYETKYCPECGAKMENNGDDDDE